MRIINFEKGLSYSDKERVLMAKKIGKIATYCSRVKDEDSFIRVEAERRETQKDRDSVKVSLEVALPGKVLRAESRREQVIEALDRCVEKIESPLLKYKEMKLDRGQRRDSVKAKRQMKGVEG